MVEGRGTPTHEPLFGDPWSHNGVTSAARRGRGHGVRADDNTGTRNVEAIDMTTQLVL